MNCTNCGTSNLDNASICVNCGRPMYPAPAAPPPPPPPPSQATYIPPQQPQGGFGAPPTAEQIPNYLIQSIVVTLCCCLPLGVVAIIFAAQVNQKLAAGDVAGAREASANAKKFSLIALILGIVSNLIIFLLALLPILREALANH